MVTITLDVPEELILLVTKEEKTTEADFLHDLQALYQAMVNKLPEIWRFKKATGEKLDVDSVSKQIMKEAGFR